MMSRRSGVGLAVVNGQLYAVGGFDGTTYLKTIEVFDQVTNSGSFPLLFCLPMDLFEWISSSCFVTRLTMMHPDNCKNQRKILQNHKRHVAQDNHVR